ncbi:MAG: hypothetical protein LCH63_02465 [Candidatus Melainabacteria bacterium]|nr:hypothetical protein [Candidatus Melainabacteria bacterium]
MTNISIHFDALKQICPAATILTEGGKALVLLPNMQVVSAGQILTMTLLLVPFEHTGYKTRLFFERKIDGRGSNWNQHRVVDKQWWAPSWQGVPADLPWTAILLEHLRCVA